MLKQTIFFSKPCKLSLRLKHVPDKGNVSMLGVTDKQFGDMEHFCSAQKQQMHIPTQLEMF